MLVLLQIQIDGAETAAVTNCYNLIITLQIFQDTSQCLHMNEALTLQEWESLFKNIKHIFQSTSFSVSFNVKSSHKHINYPSYPTIVFSQLTYESLEIVRDVIKSSWAVTNIVVL